MEKRIVIKVGSNVLTRKDGKLDVTRMSAIVDLWRGCAATAMRSSWCRAAP